MEKLPQRILFVLFSRKITCILRTIVKVCRCCDKPYILIISFFLLAYYELKKKMLTESRKIFFMSEN